MSIESVMPSNHLILCRPLLLLPSIFPSIRVFSNESALRIRWPKYWSFSFNISPSNEHPGLISFQARDSQESSPIVQKLNSSALSFLYSTTLTSIHDYWKNHSLDQTDPCRQSNVSATAHKHGRLRQCTSTAEGSYPTSEVRGGGGRSYSHVQGKE